jgi:HAD superfamily hydrolase (TIGR01549 family)
MMIRGAIFDMDGTIVDVSYDWKKIKEELETGGKPILSHIRDLSEPERSKKWGILEKHEKAATTRATLKEGIQDFLIFLKEKEVKTALVTNNSRRNVEYLLDKFKLKFDLVLSRETGLWKPSGAPFLFVLEKFRMSKGEICVIGDSHFDVKAAEEAGIKIVFLLVADKKKCRIGGAEIFQTVKALRKKVSSLV